MEKIPTFISLNEMTRKPPPTSSTLSLDRAIGLLEEVVEHAAAGASLAALAGATRLSKPTAHRLLAALRTKGLVDYDAARRLFLPGAKLFRMSLAAAVRFDAVELALPAMQRLADATGDTVYLSIRAGDEAICVARRIGAFPIKTLTLNVGDSRPLGLGAGSLALLAFLPDAEIEGIVARNRSKLAAHRNFDPVSLRSLIARTRRNGHALNDGLMLPEMAALGVPIRRADGQVAAALSVAALRSRLQDGRRDTTLKLLRREAAAIESALGVPAVKRAAA
jgi:DNA-binding IclR family transcriptional regulator